jgi:hypothetical protein
VTPLLASYELVNPKSHYSWVWSGKVHHNNGSRESVGNVIDCHESTGSNYYFVIEC